MKYLLLTVFLFVVGCAAANKFSDAGEKLYAEKCSGCHRLYAKKDFSSSDWRLKLEVMGKKARLAEEEKKEILIYLTK